MIHGETYLLCNMGLCACAYPLGGRLAGLPLPRPSRWMLAAALGGAGALCALFLPSPLWLLLLPAGVVLCFGHFGWQACLRCLVTTLCAALLCGGALNVLLRSAPPGAAWAATAALCLLLYWLASLSPSSMTAVRQVELTVGEHSVLLPAMVAERWPASRIVFFSSGNVLPLVPLLSGGADEHVAPAPVGVTYLQGGFTITLMTCPKCGLSLVPEHLAVGKMFEVEQLLEDK